jgi:hypothetical protein
MKIKKVCEKCGSEDVWVDACSRVGHRYTVLGIGEHVGLQLVRRLRQPKPTSSIKNTKRRTRDPRAKNRCAIYGLRGSWPYCGTRRKARQT